MRLSPLSMPMQPMHSKRFESILPKFKGQPTSNTHEQEKRNCLDILAATQDERSPGSFPRYILIKPGEIFSQDKARGVYLRIEVPSPFSRNLLCTYEYMQDGSVKSSSQGLLLPPGSLSKEEIHNTLLDALLNPRHDSDDD